MPSNRLVVAACALACTSVSLATVDLSLKQPFQIVQVGDVVELTIVASASGATASPFDALDAILAWDPVYLNPISSTQANADAFFFIAGFLNDIDGINADLGDGDALFTAAAPPGSIIFAPPVGNGLVANGLVVTTLRFTAQAPTDNTVVTFLPTLGQFAKTRVLLQGFEVTGNVESSAKIVIKGAAKGGCPSAGSCLEPHGGLGCEDEACCLLVCDADPFCCEVAWDAICVARACATCDGCFADLDGDFKVDGADLGILLNNWGNSGCGDLDFDGIVDGADLGILLNNWGDCAKPPFECPVASNNCFTTGGPGCTDTVCCEFVCTQDPFCCDVLWDGACVNQANMLCDGCGAAGAGDCCTANGTPFCDDRTCCDAICALDPFCCTTQWDGLCASAAQTNAACGCP